MRSIRVRAFESAPGQSYWRRWEPAMRRTRKGRTSGGSRPWSSLGRMGLLLERQPRTDQQTVRVPVGYRDRKRFRRVRQPDPYPAPIGLVPSARRDAIGPYPAGLHQREHAYVQGEDEMDVGQPE